MDYKVIKTAAQICGSLEQYKISYNSTHAAAPVKLESDKIRALFCPLRDMNGGVDRAEAKKHTAEFLEVLEK
jgi:hypothetical protein